jgi:hypothetical protein
MLVISRFASMVLVMFGSLVGYAGQRRSVYLVTPPSGVMQSG